MPSQISLIASHRKLRRLLSKWNIKFVNDIIWFKKQKNTRFEVQLCNYFLKEDNNIDIFLKQCFPKCSSALASVTRPGNFLKVLGENFGAKAGQYLVTFWAIILNKTAVNAWWKLLEKFGLLFIPTFIHTGPGRLAKVTL